MEKAIIKIICLYEKGLKRIKEKLKEIFTEQIGFKAVCLMFCELLGSALQLLAYDFFFIHYICVEIHYIYDIYDI